MVIAEFCETSVQLVLVSSLESASVSNTYWTLLMKRLSCKKFANLQELLLLGRTFWTLVLFLDLRIASMLVTLLLLMVPFTPHTRLIRKMQCFHFRNRTLEPLLRKRTSMVCDMRLNLSSGCFHARLSLRIHGRRFQMEFLDGLPKSHHLVATDLTLRGFHGFIVSYVYC